MEKINITGGGLAGSEAALYLADIGYEVNLYEMRPKKTDGAHIQRAILRNLSAPTASVPFQQLLQADFLKKEIEILGSTLIKEAHTHSVPSGNSLSIDRFGFSGVITEKFKTTKT